MSKISCQWIEPFLQISGKRVVSVEIHKIFYIEEIIKIKFYTSNCKVNHSIFIVDLLKC